MRLLEEARRLMPRLPFRKWIWLVLDEMGKNLSGTGMDTNVIRREIDGSFLNPPPTRSAIMSVRCIRIVMAMAALYGGLRS
jgi:hypothetical protein